MKREGFVLLILGTALIAGVILSARFDTNQSGNKKSYHINCEQPNLGSEDTNSLSCALDRADDTPQSQTKNSWWHKLISFPEAATAWLVMLTLGAIVWQAWETRKAAQGALASAETALKQTNLQTSAMKQWVNIVPIKVCMPRKITDPTEVSLQFEIVNKTDYLLTILKTDVEVIASLAVPSKIFNVDCIVPLAPQKIDGDSSHPFYVRALVSIRDWSDKGRIFIVAGSVTYRNCMELEVVQDFHDLYLGFMDGRLERMKPAGMTPTVADYEPQNPD